MTIRTLTAVTDVLRFESYLRDLAGTILPNIAEILSTEQPASARSLPMKEVQTLENDFTSVFESRDGELYSCLISVLSAYERLLKHKVELPGPFERTTPLSESERDGIEAEVETILESRDQQMKNATRSIIAIYYRHAKLRTRLLERYAVMPVGAFRSELSHIHSEFDELIKRLCYNPGGIYDLRPRRFEELVAEIWARMGYQVELTPQSRDGGRDIVATKVSELKSQVLIECKRYSRKRPVGLDVVQRMLGALAQYDATQGVIATTSKFTRDAMKVISAKPNQLTGHDYKDLVNLLWRVQLVVVPRPHSVQELRHRRG